MIINIDLKRPEGPDWDEEFINRESIPCYHVTINGITEEYRECNLFPYERLDLYLNDSIAKRIILNNSIEVKVSDEVEEYWLAIED